MMADWSRTAERLMLSAIENKIRVLALTSPLPGAGVTSVAVGLAAASARAGRKTLLIDLSEALRAGDGNSGWIPGEPLAANAIFSGDDGMARIAASTSAAARARFSNVDRVKHALEQDFASYEHIILDLAAVDGKASEGLNPLAAARAADAVILVALTGLTYRTELTTATQALRQVGANVAGLVLNDQYCATFGEEIADVAYSRLGRWFPRTAERIAQKALATSYFANGFRIVR